MSIETLLRDQIESDMKELERIEVGSDSYRAGVDGVTKMVDRVIEYEKLKSDNQFKVNQQSIDAELKEKELEIDNKDRLLKNIVTGIGVVGGFGLTIWGTFKTFEFEKEGTITTMMGRGFIGKLMPKK